MLRNTLLTFAGLLALVFAAGSVSASGMGGDCCKKLKCDITQDAGSSGTGSVDPRAPRSR